MATITVMKNYIIKKAQGTSDDKLKKIVKVLKNYNKLDAETKKQVGVAVEKMYTQLKAKESKKATPKAGTTPKSTGKKKLSTQDLKSAIAKFKEKVGAKTWKQATSGTSIKEDAERPALPKGKRYSKITGNPYWENRANRSDVKQPPKTYPRLAKGGLLSKEDALQKAIDMGVDFEKDFHAQSFGNELSELAKKVGYRKSPSASGSLGREFFYHLQKMYNKMKGKKFAKGGDVDGYGREQRWLLIFVDEDENAIQSNVIAENKKEAEKEARYQEGDENGKPLGDKWELDSIYSLGYFAKGGMTEHGLKTGDKIISGKVIGTTIIVEDTYGKRAKVDLNSGKRIGLEYDSKSKKYVEKK